VLKIISGNHNIRHVSLDHLQGIEEDKVVLEKDEQGQV
jgi:hypothetical protein